MQDDTEEHKGDGAALAANPDVQLPQVATKLHLAVIDEEHPHREEALATIRPIQNYDDTEQLNTHLLRHPSIMHLPTTHIDRAQLSPHEQHTLMNPRWRANPLHDIKSPQYKKFCHDFFQEAFRAPQHTLEDLTPFRVRTCYRIVREMARLRNLCSTDETINTALCATSEGRDNYYMPTNDWSIEHYCDYGIKFEQFLNNVFYMPTEELCWYRNRSDTKDKEPVLQAPGLPIAPPHPPLSAMALTDDGLPYVKETYDPRTDLALGLYMDLIRMIIDRLQLGGGTENDPESGFLGLQGILNPFLIRIAWPTRTELFAYEYLLIQEIVMTMVREGTRKTREKLVTDYGFTEMEIEGHMRMARQMAKKMTEMDQEEDKAISLLRLEEYGTRAREALDLKAEMNAMKHAAMVTGLTRAETNDQMKDFIDVVKRVSAKSAKKATQKVLEKAQEQGKIGVLAQE